MKQLWVIHASLSTSVLGPINNPKNCLTKLDLSEIICLTRFHSLSLERDACSWLPRKSHSKTFPCLNNVRENYFLVFYFSVHIPRRWKLMYKDEFLCMYEYLKTCTADLLISRKVEWEPQRFCLYPPTGCAKNFKLTLPLLILASSSWCWETLSLYIYDTRNAVWLASFNESKFNLINHHFHHHHHH